MKIDAHQHFIAEHPDFEELLEEFDLRTLNLAFHYESEYGDWSVQVGFYREAARKWPDRYAWCTSFDLPGFDDPDYADKCIEKLEQDFADGAVGCKIWKSLGLSLRDPDGEHVKVDHPILQPIFDYLEKRGKPLVSHIGEPYSCWQPLSERDPCYQYYKNHPQYQFYGRTDCLTHAEVMGAVDLVVETHPDLRVIGAHLGSFEYDVAEIARRFELYPNFAVDTSARPGYLALQDRDKVRQFFRKYSDRIIWGTDGGGRNQSSMPEERRKAQYNYMRRKYKSQFVFYETDEVVNVQNVEAKGLALPDDVLEKFYVTNARNWFPGLVL